MNRIVGGLMDMYRPTPLGCDTGSFYIYEYLALLVFPKAKCLR